MDKTKRKRKANASTSDEPEETKLENDNDGTVDKVRKKPRKKETKVDSSDLPNVSDAPNDDGNDGEQAEPKKPIEEPFHYQVLGQDTFDDLKKLRSVPDWIDRATTFSTNLAEDGAPLASVNDIDGDLLSFIRKAKTVKEWFPVQKAVLPTLFADLERPPVLPPRDICISAPTGSGKTLCYVLPIIQSLRHRMTPFIRALVMLPVQDLAVQVYHEFEKYNLWGLRLALLTGNKDYDAERRELFPGDQGGAVCMADVVIATPGRLLDHLLDDRPLPLHQLRYLVVDEADRMMTDARLGWLGQVERAVFANRPRIASASFSTLQAANRPPLQKILLSATLSQDVERLQQWNLFQPRLFRANVDQRHKAEQQQTDAVENAVSVQQLDEIEGALALPAELKQHYATSDSNLKPLVLFTFLVRNADWGKVLCFAGSRESSSRLAVLLTSLADGLFVVEQLTANLFGNRRQKVLKRFANGRTRVLICSDLVARGMDFEAVDCVVNYACPNNERSYLHRAGRTARAGRSGCVVSIVDTNEFKTLQTMLEAADVWHGIEELKTDQDLIDKYKEKYRKSLEQLRTELTDKKPSLRSRQRKQGKAAQNR